MFLRVFSLVYFRQTKEQATATETERERERKRLMTVVERELIKIQKSWVLLSVPVGECIMRTLSLSLPHY